MSTPGYRALEPGTACSRCGAPTDPVGAVLSTEGLPLCTRCNASAQIAAADLPPLPTSSIPWNDAKVSFGVGAALLVGVPVSIAGLWNGWLSFDVVLAFYLLGVPLAAVTSIRALSRPKRPPDLRPRHEPILAPAWPAPAAPPKAMTSSQDPAPSPPIAHDRPPHDVAMAAAGATMAATGCGAISIVFAVIAVFVVAVCAYAAYVFLRIVGLI